MKLFTNGIVIAAVIALPAFGQNAAVMIKEFTAKNVSAGDVSAVTEIFQNAILGTKKFRIIERAGIADILKEQEFQLSGATDTKYAVAVGKIVSVNYLFSGSVSKLGSDYYVAVKLINVETAEIEDAWDANAASIGAIGPAVKELAAKAGGIKQVAAVNALSTGAYVEKTIANRDDITVIDLNDTKATDDDLAAKIRHPEKIKVLRLANSLVTDRFMRDTFSKMTAVETVVLRNNKAITGSGAINGFVNIFSLRSINFDDCPFASDDVMIQLFQNNIHLSEIIFGGTPAGDQSFINGISRLSNISRLVKWSSPGDPIKLTDVAVDWLTQSSPSIKYLGLGYNSLSDRSVNLMTSRLKSPTSIILDGNNLSAEALKTLQQSFPKCYIQILRELALRGPEYNDNYVRAHISDFSGIELIRINGTSITDDGVILIVKNSSKVRSLFIYNSSEISDRSLIEGLAYAKQITGVYLYGCSGITDKGAKALVDSLARLRYFEAYNTSISQEGIDYVKKKFPECIIKYNLRVK